MNLKLGLTLLIAAMVAATVQSANAGESKWTLPMRDWSSTSASSSSACKGRVGECIDPEEEGMMESEAAHRQLFDMARYISYDAMNKNNIPCDQPGNSYYNCRGNNAANPYRRGCTAITNCARKW